MSDADLPSALAPIVCLPIGKLHYLFLDSFPLFTTSKNVGKDKALCCRLLRRLKAKLGWSRCPAACLAMKCHSMPGYDVSPPNSQMSDVRCQWQVGRGFFADI